MWNWPGLSSIGVPRRRAISRLTSLPRGTPPSSISERPGSRLRPSALWPVPKKLADRHNNGLYKNSRRRPTLPFSYAGITLGSEGPNFFRVIDRRTNLLFQPEKVLSTPVHQYLLTNSNPLYERLKPKALRRSAYSLSSAGFSLILSTEMIFSGLNSLVSKTLKKAR